MWCFVNHGRVVAGGTHEEGLLEAIELLGRQLELPDRFGNGMVIVASIRYPDVVWEGCIEEKIINPELRSMVCSLVLEGSKKWLQERPGVVRQIRRLETFRIPEVWFET